MMVIANTASAFANVCSEALTVLSNLDDSSAVTVSPTGGVFQRQDLHQSRDAPSNLWSCFLGANLIMFPRCFDLSRQQVLKLLSCSRVCGAPAQLQPLQGLRLEGTPWITASTSTRCLPSLDVCPSSAWYQLDSRTRSL